MRKITMFIFAFLLVLPLVALAQDVEVDVQAYLGVASALFATGIGGMTVLGIVEIIKRTFKAQGIFVRIISVFVSAGFALIYELGVGFLWYRFAIVTFFVALAANGIYLFPKQKSAY